MTSESIIKIGSRDLSALWVLPLFAEYQGKETPAPPSEDPQSLGVSLVAPLTEEAQSSQPGTRRRGGGWMQGRLAGKAHRGLGCLTLSSFVPGGDIRATLQR